MQQNPAKVIGAVLFTFIVMSAITLYSLRSENQSVIDDSEDLGAVEMTQMMEMADDAPDTKNVRYVAE